MKWYFELGYYPKNEESNVLREFSKIYFEINYISCEDYKERVKNYKKGKPVTDSIR
jgi:hypothetical protein